MGNPNPPVLLTIGHSNHTLEGFVNLLVQHRVEVLVDTRSYPYSKFVPHFNKDSIRRATRHHCIKYLFMGNELGGRPEGRDFYDDEGHALYYRISKAPTFIEAIDRLKRGIALYRVAIMCSEENPSVCHRCLLVGRVMGDRGANVLHIRGDGRLQSDDELQLFDRSQRLLFDQGEETSWKSIQSVLPRSRPGSSSKSYGETGLSG